MKKIAFLLLGAALALDGSPLLDLSDAGIPPDTGEGEIRIISAERGKALHTSKVWQKSPHLHRRDHRNFPDVYKCSAVVNTPDGVKLTTSEKFARVSFPDGIKSNFSTRFFHRMKLKPEYAGKKLIVAFKVRGRLYSVPSANYLYGGIAFRRGPKDKEGISRLGNLTMPVGTAEISFADPIPKDAVFADLHLALYGCGELEILEAVIKLGDAGNAMAPDVIVSTSGYTDRQFYLPYKMSFPVFFSFRREFTYKPRSVRLFVEMPNGFVCTGYGLEMKRLPDQGGVWVFDARYPFVRTIIRSTFCNWRHNGVLVRADVEPSGKFYTMRYWVEADGKASTPRTLKLKVVPSEEHPAPRILKSGLHYPSFNATRFDASGAEAFTEMYKKCGFNLISARIFPELSEVLRKAKIERIGGAMPMRNGFRVYAQVPPDQGFIGIDGKPIPRSFCPVAVYERKSAYIKNVVELTRKNLGPGGPYDHAGGNWEPYIYDYKGCYCDTCCGEFAEYAKLDLAEVKKYWPADLLKKYPKEWVRFRSWQHGKVVRTINEDVKKAGAADGGKNSFFIPDISYYGFTDAKSDQQAQYNSRDYAYALDRVCIWGPYAHKASLHGRYRYVPAQHLPYVLACDKVNEYLHRTSKATVMGLPQGSHVDWVTTPEAVVFETLAGFVAGHSMSVPFWFAYDYRAYREMGRMNSLLAGMEKFLTEGKRGGAVQGKAVTPYLEARHWRPVVAGTHLETIFPEIMNCSALQLRRIDLGKETLIAAANTWEQSSVFFELRLPDRKGSDPLVLTDLESGESLKVTGDMLNKGVELYVKELHWGFFRIAPFDKNKKYAFITPQTIAERKKVLLPAIRKAFEAENKLLAESGGTQVASFDFGAQPEIRSGELVCRPVKNSAAGAVEIVSPNYRIELEPAVNGRISSWKVGKTELVLAGPGLGFGVAGCWMPHRRHLRGKFVLTDVKAVGGKLLAELLLPPDRHSSLETRSRYLFDTTGFRQELEVCNRARMPLDIMVRFHTFSTMLLGGRIMAGKGELPIQPRVIFFRHGAEIPAAEVPLRAEETFQRPADHCVITKKGVPFELEFEGVDLYGVLMWGNPGQTAASFEPTYKPFMRLSPGQSARAVQSWHIKPNVGLEASRRHRLP